MASLKSNSATTREQSLFRDNGATDSEPAETPQPIGAAKWGRVK